MSTGSFASDSFIFADHKAAESVDPRSPWLDVDHDLVLRATEDGPLVVMTDAVQDDGLLLPTDRASA